MLKNLQDTEIIINCRQTNDEILKLIAMLRVLDCKLTGMKNHETYILEAAKILYIDTVDKKTFFYTGKDVYETPLKLYELEELYDRLINIILNSNGLYMLIEYEKILKDIYPKELLNKYENTIKAMAINTSGRAHYREIVSILRRMKKYPKGKEKVSEIVSDWRLRYRNRPAMMDELNKL